MRLRLLIGMLLVGLPLAFWLFQPWPLLLRWVDPTTTAYMRSRVAEAGRAGTDLALRHRWVPADSISPLLVRAVLVAEDDRFHEHRGVDWRALAEELRYDGDFPPDLRNPEDREALAASWSYLAENRDRLRGRSTLTQQLARNLYLSEDRTPMRKLRELLIARRLERFLSKERILEIYLNVAELGEGVFGVAAAAEVYFGRSPGALSREEAASLAATLPHPRTSNPARDPGRMLWRRDLILARLGGGSAPIPPPIDPDELRIEIPAPDAVEAPGLPPAVPLPDPGAPEPDSALPGRDSIP